MSFLRNLDFMSHGRPLAHVYKNLRRHRRILPDTFYLLFICSITLVTAATDTFNNQPGYLKVSLGPLGSARQRRTR